MLWDDWIQNLEQLPVDSPEWATAETFIERVRDLSNRKRSGLQSHLQDALDALYRDCAAEIEFFGLTDDIQSWQARQCCHEQQGAAYGHVQKLHTLLQNDRQTRNTVARTVAADREQRAKLESLDQDISELCALLRETFTHDIKSSTMEPGTPVADVKLAQEKPPIVPVEPAKAPLSLRPPFDLEGPRRRKKLDDATIRELFAPEALIPPIFGIVAPLPPKRTTSSSSSRGPATREHAKGSEKQVAAKPKARLSEESPEIPFPSELAEPIVLPEPTDGEVEQLDVGESAGDYDSQTTITTEGSEEHHEDKPQDPLPERLQEPPVAINATLEPLLLEMVCADDLSGAYWLARSMEACDTQPTYPSWLIAAVQGAFWEPGDDTALAADLLDITTSQQPLPKGLPCQMLGVAASLYPALTEPMCNMGVWLETSLPFPKLHAIVEGVRDFVRFGRKLRPEDTGDRQTRDQAETALKSVVQQAAKWLRDAANRHTKLYRANHMWSYLVRQGGALHNMLQPVIQDLRSRVGEVRQAAGDWSRPDDVRRRLHLFDLELHGKTVKPIQASPQNQLMGWIDEACKFAQQWSELVERMERLTSRVNWIDEQVDRLARCLSTKFAGATREMAELAAADSPDIAASARCIQLAIARIEALFHRDISDLPEKDTTSQTAFACLADNQPRGLWAGLRRRLWWISEIGIDDEGVPLEDQVPEIATALELAWREKRLLRASIEQWMALEDFRFTPFMIDLLHDEADRTELEQQHRLLMETSRHRLQALVDRTEVAIEKALSDGVILDIDRSKPQGMLASICAAETVNFPPAFAKLSEAEAFLSAKQRERLEYQRSLWRIHREKLLTAQNGAGSKKLIDFVEAALDRGDTRVVDECVSRLQEAYAQGIQPAIEWFVSPPAPRDALGDFLSSCASIEQSLGDARVWGPDGIRKLLRIAGVAVDSLPGPRIDEAERALTAWRHLKKGDAQAVAGLGPSVLRVLQFLGLEPKDPRNAIELVTSRSGWAHFRAQVSAGGLSPVPQFGSLREDDYDVVCLWERPGALTLVARLREARLGSQPTIVLYLGRLKANQRLSLARHVHQGEKLQILVVDEVLLAYLAGERDARLPVCFGIALPFATLNPYTPDSAGNVPPEMFVGRGDMIRALLDTGGNGSCVVYGGRQLGKSALLRRVQREFHNPAQGRYAIYEDIKLGSSTEFVGGIWTDWQWRRAFSEE